MKFKSQKPEAVKQSNTHNEKKLEISTRINVRKAALFVNSRKENSINVSNEISSELKKRGAEVNAFIFDWKEKSGKTAPDKEISKNCDIAFTLGGDGTVLGAARILANTSTPIFPIHLGTLGFLASVESFEWLKIYEDWLLGKARISSRCMLEFSIERDGRIIHEKNFCLNDIVVSSSGIAKLSSLSVAVEIAKGEYTDLGSHRVDGLIVATPTGSTAYSMAAGGPIIEPEMEAKILCPVCPFAVSNRPLTLPLRQNLRIQIENEQRSDIILTVDGQSTFSLEPGDVVLIKDAPYKTPLITAGRHAYYEALKNKLGWGPV